MNREKILLELERLPLTDKLLVIEQTIKSIRTEKEKSLKIAVNSLYNDYSSVKDLVAFTQLDIEPFYETR